MIASIHPETHCFCYFVVLGTVMLKCLDVFILGISLFYFAYSKAVMFLTFDIDVFIFTDLDTVQLC